MNNMKKNKRKRIKIIIFISNVKKLIKRKIKNKKNMNHISKIKKPIKKKKRRIRWNNVRLALVFLIFLIILIIAIVNISKWLIDSNNNKKQTKEIEENVEVNEVQDSNNTEIIKVEEEIPKENPYWDYIKMNLIDVDFAELKNINTETKGWLQVKGTNVNYPFVQANDNDFYLNHTFNKSYNDAGWVFLDYRNNIENFNKNTIIYAHGRLDDSMFGSLRRILNSGWLNNTNNHVIKLSTEYENTLWQVFSVYRIPTTSDYIKVNFDSDKSFVEFANMLINRSAYNFNTTINENDLILTLSTCYDDNDKVVLHAKLIKKEKK